ncbi:MAG: hypothetical protein GOP50_09655 [Candidatus Heimdallarchaeota archaeon]|nr:hypothetical protein [Candidatus Heimdallarchaeota archaeon]
MTLFIGVPEDYQVYMYTALGLMIGGVVFFIVSLFDMMTFLLAASLTAVGFGFLISAGMAMAFIRKKKRDRNAEIVISTLVRIILIIVFALTTYLIIFSGFFILEQQYSTNCWITQAIAIPVVVIALIVADILVNRRRKKKKEKEELDEKLKKEFEEDQVE